MIGKLGCATLVAILAYGYFQENRELTNYSPNCPHPAFSRKHHCSHCRTEQDALAFSRQRDDTNVNTVVFGDPQFKIEDEYCISTGTKVVKCTLNTGFCRTLGNVCETRHSTGNGHMFYTEIYCDDEL